VCEREEKREEVRDASDVKRFRREKMSFTLSERCFSAMHSTVVVGG